MTATTDEQRIEQLEAEYAEALFDESVEGRRRARELAADPLLGKRLFPMVSPNENREVVRHVREQVETLERLGTEAELAEREAKAIERLEKHRRGALAKALDRERELAVAVDRIREAEYERRLAMRAIRLHAEGNPIIDRATRRLREAAGVA